jgi:hypothetical protein
VGDQARRPIHEELLSIPGIAGAEFEGDPSTPDGVRIQLAPGADPDAIGLEVKRVLAGHGMRSQMTAPAVAPRVPPPPPEPRTVVNLADFDPSIVAVEDALPEPGDDTGSADDPSVEAGSADHPADGMDRDPAPMSSAVPILGDVVITQRGGGVTVSVAAGDRVATRPAVASEEGIDNALLEAVCEVLGVAPVPMLISVAAEDLSGSAAVSVLVDDGTARHAGSAVDRGNRAWAVARAFWSAVSGPA